MAGGGRQRQEIGRRQLVAFLSIEAEARLPGVSGTLARGRIGRARLDRGRTTLARGLAGAVAARVPRQAAEIGLGHAVDEGPPAAAHEPTAEGAAVPEGKGEGAREAARPVAHKPKGAARRGPPLGPAQAEDVEKEGHGREGGGEAKDFRPQRETAHLGRARELAMPDEADKATEPGADRPALGWRQGCAGDGGEKQQRGQGGHAQKRPRQALVGGEAPAPEGRHDADEGCRQAEGLQQEVGAVSAGAAYEVARGAGRGMVEGRIGGVVAGQCEQHREAEKEENGTPQLGEATAQELRRLGRQQGQPVRSVRRGTRHRFSSSPDKGRLFSVQKVNECNGCGTAKQALSYRATQDVAVMAEVPHKWKRQSSWFCLCSALSDSHAGAVCRPRGANLHESIYSHICR